MTHDQEIVEQLQRRLSDWNPDKPCGIHSSDRTCDYDEQGQLIGLHLCGLELVEVPSEIWSCSSLQKLSLIYNQLSTLPAEVGQLTSLQVFDLENNQLSTLPAAVGNLSSLQRLYLSD